jgi:glycosyltransferase involved in cell wall biosynthesis
MTRISIVTPSFNQAAFIEEALWSVKRQDYPNVEHIVMDGASTDGTVEILRRYSAQPGWEHLHWVSEPDRGQSDALNKGFRIAKGDFIGWLNSDDLYRPRCFQHVLDAFGHHAHADIIYGDYTWIDEKGKVWRVRKEIDFSLFILRYHRVLYIPTTSTFFRHRIFAEGNFIDLRYHYAMDYEFFLRLAHVGYRFQHINQVLADFRWHANSKSGAWAAKQLEEHDAIARQYSPLLREMTGIRQTAVLKCLRGLAAMYRYGDKLLNGSYFASNRVVALEN